jgi:hypothetical protein
VARAPGGFQVEGQLAPLVARERGTDQVVPLEVKADTGARQPVVGDLGQRRRQPYRNVSDADTLSAGQPGSCASAVG